MPFMSVEELSSKYPFQVEGTQPCEDNSSDYLCSLDRGHRSLHEAHGIIAGGKVRVLHRW